MKGLLIALFSLPILLCGQSSIHQQQLEYYNGLGNANANHYESTVPAAEMPSRTKSLCSLDRVVYGWHPYWVGSTYNNYDWDLLSHFSFFSYEVDAATGNANSTHGWATSGAVDAALASGNTKVTLCVTLFSNHNTFFASSTAQQTLITNLINLVQSRGAHGVQIDFEGIPNSQKTNFANWMVDLSTQMKAAIPGAEVSTVLYAVDWNDVFDFGIMEPHVDHYIIMGYAYYYQGSSNTGPCDPLYHFGSTYNYTLSRSITYYLDKGCPANKLVMGLPYYGYEWPTTSTTVPSPTTGSGSARTYAVVMNNSSGDYIPANYVYDQDSYSDAYSYDNGIPEHTFITLEGSFRKRLEHIRRTGIAGMGIWALGYDDGYTELWTGIEDYMTACYQDSCSGEIHDFGGPYKDYYDDEDYTWTVAPTGASSIDITFTEFDVELNFDYLYIYDGPDVLSPQIAGSPFTGTTGPGSFTTSTGAVTFRFYSDGATNTPGFYATYTCNTSPAPTASFSATGTNVCMGDSIQLINSSTDASSYYWQLSGPGTLSNDTVANPWLVPTTTGTFVVDLTATGPGGADSTTQNINIVVVDPPVANGFPDNSTVNLPTATVNFTNTSSNAISYFWDFDDGSTSTDVNPWHAFTAAGTYNVMLVAENGICANDTMFFAIVVNGAVGIEEAGSDLVVFPNPFEGHLYISGIDKPIEYSLYDLSGQLMGNGFTNNEISLSHLATGTYILEINFDGVLIHKRVFKE